MPLLRISRTVGSQKDLDQSTTTGSVAVAELHKMPQCLKNSVGKNV